MKVFINDQAIHVLPGMTVRHALILIGVLQEIGESKNVYDEWENEFKDAIKEAGLPLEREK